MMKKAIISILLCTLYFGCKRKEKEEPITLPEVSTVGANTFGCKVNGGFFFNDGPVGGRFFNYIRQACNDTGDFNLRYKSQIISFSNKAGHTIIFYSDDLENGKNIIRNFDQSTAPWPADLCPLSYARYVDASGKAFQTDENHVGQIKLLLFDYDRRYVSGTFSFKAVHEPAGEVVEVTDGRFDINLNIYR